MNRIEQKFTKLKEKKQKAFIAYICAGDPNLSFTEKLVIEFDRIGVDVVELGIPFSDPIADGPTIQRASERALKNGTTIVDVLKLVKKIRKISAIPIVFMGYFNPLLRYGLKRFVKDAVLCGVDGLIVADLPFEESDTLIELARAHGLAHIPLVAPTTKKSRLKHITRSATGFVYYISLTGITGARKKLSNKLLKKLRFVKSVTRKPVCTGFGISYPHQIKDMKKLCDGVIVGSAIIDVIEKNITKKNSLSKVSSFTNKLARATKTN